MIGITGQIGAGKSYVGDGLRKKGFKVVDADAAVHYLYGTDERLRQKIAEEFGKAALTSEGVDRKFFADLIFRDGTARRRLESLVYPALTEYIVGQSPDYVEAALFENVPHLVEMLDELWIVTAPAEVRLRRLTGPRGLSPEDASRRMALQKDKDSDEFWMHLFPKEKYPGLTLKFIRND